MKKWISVGGVFIFLLALIFTVFKDIDPLSYSIRKTDISEDYSKKTILSDKKIEDRHIIKSVKTHGKYVYTFDTKKNAASYIKKSGIEEDKIVSIGKVEGMNTSESKEIDTEEADVLVNKKANIRKDNITVAVIDTGYDFSSYKTDRVIDSKINYSNTGNINSSMDDNGHGTDITNIILKNTNTNVSVIPIKIANQEGKATTSGLVCAISDAIDMNVDIINISMELLGTSKQLEDIINKAYQKDISVVVCAGNNGKNVLSYCPANIEKAITISAIERINTNVKKPVFSFAEYSNHGKTIDYSAFGNYKGKHGTSYATAYATAAIAQYGKDLSKCGEDLGDPGKDKFYGEYALTKNLILEDIDTESPYIAESNNEYDIGSDLIALDWKNTDTELLNQYVINTDPKYVGCLLSSLTTEDSKLFHEKCTVLGNEKDIYELDLVQKDSTKSYKTSGKHTSTVEEYALKSYNDVKDEVTIQEWKANSEMTFYVGTTAKHPAYKVSVTGITGQYPFSYDESKLKVTVTKNNKDDAELISKPTSASINLLMNNARGFTSRIYEYNNKTKNMNSSYDIAKDKFAEYAFPSNDAKDNQYRNGWSNGYSHIDVNNDDGKIFETPSITLSGIKNQKTGYHFSNATAKMYRHNTEKLSRFFSLEYVDYSNGATITRLNYDNFKNIDIENEENNKVTLLQALQKIGYSADDAKKFAKTQKDSSVVGKNTANFKELQNAMLVVGYGAHWKDSNMKATSEANCVLKNVTGWSVKAKHIKRTGSKDTLEENNGTITLNTNNCFRLSGVTFIAAEVSPTTKTYVTDTTDYIFTPVANKYYVAYNANGGTGSIDDSEFTYDKTGKLTKNSNKITRTGYIFTGWNTQADGTGTARADGASVLNWTASNKAVITLYAQWKPITYKVHFNANGGNGSMSDQTFNYDEEKALSSNTFAKSGYHFEKWTTNANGTGTSYTNGCKVKNLTTTNDGIVNLYAKWIDDIKPVASVTAEPSTWAKEANVTITALDEGSGVKNVQLYRVDSSNKETLVQTWTENPTITTQKTYTFVDTEEGSYSYKVVVSDNVGNQGVATSGKVYIDRTAPVVDESVVQGPGTYQFPVANLKNDNDEVNSECFGLYITLDASDKNGTKAVSNIKQAYVKVYNTDKPSQCYLYDLTQKAENTIERSGVDVEVPSPLNGELNTINQVAFEKRAIIDLTKDFNRVLNLSWEIHVIDVAGNDAYDVNPALKGSHQRDVEVFATIRRITYDKDLTSPTQFKSGYRGILRLTTTGWVDRINTHWAQEILQASLKDQELNQAVMIYDTTLNQDPASNPTVNISGQKLNENNTIKTIDTHNTGFTRTYDFYFWIPLYQEFKDASGNHPYLTRDGIYTINVDTERDYEYPQLNDGIKNTSVKLTIGEGSITQKFRASIVD